MRRDLIYIAIIIGLALFAYINFDKSNAEIEALENKEKVYQDQIHELDVDLKENNAYIIYLDSEIFAYKKLIDSIDNVPIPTYPDYSDVPYDERNDAITRLAKE